MVYVFCVESPIVFSGLHPEAMEKIYPVNPGVPGEAWPIL
jgi:hypothetical protein